MIGLLTTVALLVSAPVGSAAEASGRDDKSETSRTIATPDVRFPDGTELLEFEDVEGVVLIRATVRGEAGPQLPGRDTTGWFALDTGVGFLALDAGLAVALGVEDSIPDRPIAFASRALPELMVGDLALSQVQPVVLFDSRLLQRVTDRAVLGLIGYSVLQDRALWIDFASRRVALVPAGPELDRDDPSAIGESRRLLSGTLSSDAIPCRFRMTGDGKILLRTRVTPMRGGGPTPWLTLVLDTGASKSTLFEDVVAPLFSTAEWRPTIRGLAAPTLLATSTARLCRLRSIEVRGSAGTAEARNVDLALIQNPLADQLERLAGEQVHGLLGYSFLKRFRIACDYPRRVLWLDPRPKYRDDHPYEHVHVGLQLERTAGDVRVVAVAEGSPAALAGIAAGDQLVAIDSVPVAGLGWAEVGARMQGEPGTSIVLTVRRGEAERVHRLRRRRLL